MDYGSTYQQLDNDLTWLAEQQITTIEELVDHAEHLSSWETPTYRTNDASGDAVSTFWANLREILAFGSRNTVPPWDPARLAD